MSSQSKIYFDTKFGIILKTIFQRFGTCHILLFVNFLALKNVSSLVP